MDAELADVDSAALDAAGEGVEAAAPEDARQAKLRQLRERLVRRSLDLVQTARCRASCAVGPLGCS